MADITIEQIEDAILSALAGLQNTHGVRDLKTYGGDLETGDDIAKAGKRWPAVYVQYTGSRYLNEGQRKIERVGFGLIVCEKNLRGEAAARRGHGSAQGAYALLQAIRSALAGSMLGLDIMPMEIQEQELVWNEAGRVIYGAGYECGVLQLHPVRAS